MKKMKEIAVINSIIYFFFVLQSKNYGGVAAYIKIHISYYKINELSFSDDI